MPVEFKGFDEAIRKIKDLRRRAEQLHGEHDVKLTDLFPPAFMRRHTSFQSIEQMLEASPIEGELDGEISEALAGQKWDQFVQEHTQFTGWEDMRDTAAAEWAKGELGL